MYTIMQKLISQNRPGTKLKPIGIVLHETANPGAPALNHFTFYNSKYRGASAHVFIDWITEIVQTIPWNEVAWHAGRTANLNYIGIELCYANSREDFKIVWDKVVWLFAFLFINVIKITTVTKENFMSHYEVSMKWKETTHVDPVSYLKEYGKTVDDFRAAVQNQMYCMLGEKGGAVLWNMIYSLWQKVCLKILQPWNAAVSQATMQGLGLNLKKVYMSL